MSIKRSVVSLLASAGLALGAVAFSAPASADTSELGASLNRMVAEDPPADDDEGEEFVSARKGASLN